MPHPNPEGGFARNGYNPESGFRSSIAQIIHTLKARVQCLTGQGIRTGDDNKGTHPDSKQPGSRGGGHKAKILVVVLLILALLAYMGYQEHIQRAKLVQGDVALNLYANATAVAMMFAEPI